MKHGVFEKGWQVNRYTIRSHNWDTPNNEPLMIPLADVAGGDTFAIVRYMFLSPNWREPKSKTRFEFSFIKQHRTYLEFNVRYGLATDNGVSIIGQEVKMRNRLKIHLKGRGQIAAIDGLLLVWEGEEIFIRCSYIDGTCPAGMEKGAGTRLVEADQAQGGILPDWIIWGLSPRYR